MPDDLLYILGKKRKKKDGIIVESSICENYFEFFSSIENLHIQISYQNDPNNYNNPLEFLKDRINQRSWYIVFMPYNWAFQFAESDKS